MYKIFVHFPTLEDCMDNNISFPIEMPFVPRLGDKIWLDNKDYAHLEEKVEQSDFLREKYKRWMIGKSCSFDDAFVVIDVVWWSTKKEIHIEMGETLNELEEMLEAES